MGRSPCCVKEGLNKGAWTEMEDKILTEYIKVHGEGRWRNLPKKAGLKRCGKSCRLRWLNYLRPDIKRGNITPDEEELIIRLHKLLGNRWSLIAGRLPGRTDNEIKNYWNTTLGKRVNQHSRNNNSTTCKHLKKPPNIQKGKRVLSSNQSMTHSPQTEFSVVRTKAVRCTKVIVNQLQPQPQPQPRQCTQSSDGIILQPSSMDNNIKDSLINHDPSTMVVEEETIMPKDLKVDDFNMGDFNLIADLLNSEFTEICDFSNESSSNNANDLSTNSLHQPFVFSQDMLEDWLSLEIN